MNIFLKKQTKRRFVGVVNKFNYQKSVSLCSVQFGFVSEEALEASRRLLRKMLGKSVKILRRVFPNITLTSKPAEVRMGRGKGGKIRGKVCFVKPGQMVFEIYFLTETERAKIKNVLVQVKKKISVFCKVLSKKY